MPSVAVNSPKTPVTTSSLGIAAATVPNVCKMPPIPLPVPQPNIGMSGLLPLRYSVTVKIEGSPVAIQGASFGTLGDITSLPFGGGVVSNNAQGPASFIGQGALNVRIEGRNVQLLGDAIGNNCGIAGTPPNAATLPGIMQAPLIAD